MSASHLEPEVLNFAHLENFYRILCQGSLNPKEMYSQTLFLLEKNFFTYLLFRFNKIKSDLWSEAKKRILLSQLDLLKNNFFKDKIEDSIFSALKKMISNDEKIQIDDDPESLFSRLNDIKKEAENQTENNTMVPVVLKTGLTPEERTTMNYSNQYQSSLVNRNANKKGLEFLESKEFEAAIHSFKEAIALEENFANELKCERNDHVIQIYIKNLSSTYCAWGNHFYNAENYENALEKYRLALQLAEQISPKNKSDEERLVILTRNCSYANNRLGLHSCNSKEYQAAIELFTRALDDINKIPTSYFSEQDEYWKTVYLQNLATTYNQLGNSFLREKKYDDAITGYQKAIDLVNGALQLDTTNQNKIKRYESNKKAASKKQKILSIFNKKRKFDDINGEQSDQFTVSKRGKK